MKDTPFRYTSNGGQAMTYQPSVMAIITHTQHTAHIVHHTIHSKHTAPNTQHIANTHTIAGLMRNFMKGVRRILQHANSIDYDTIFERIEIESVSPATKYADPIKKITQSRNLMTERQKE